MAATLFSSRLSLLALCLTLGVIGIIGDQRYRNLSQALKHAQEKIADLDHALEYSRKRADTLNKKLKQSQQELNALVHENKKKEESVDTITAAAMQATQIAPPSCPKPSPCPPPPPCKLPPQTAEIQPSASARAEARAALAAAARDGATAADGASAAAAAELEGARFLLREALATEEQSWCSCPPLPNVTLLCAGALRAGAAADEVESLRRAVVQANARAQQASEQAVLRAAASS